MAPIDSVNIRTRSLSSNWYSSKGCWLRSVVRLGLGSDDYIVLTVNDNVSLAAQVCVQVCMHVPYLRCWHMPHTMTRFIIVQGAQLKFSKLVDCRGPHANARYPMFWKQLEHKTLLDHRPGETSFLEKVHTLRDLPECAGLVRQPRPWCCVRSDTLTEQSLTTVHKVELQVADDFAGILDAVLRVCLQAVGMPGNALADVLDDPEPLPYMPSSSFLQAISYSGD